MADRNATVVVTSDETLPGLIERLRDAALGGRTVHLIVPIDSSLLLTANEFRRLKDAVDEQRIPMVLRTADPLRLQLGERLGLRVQAAPRPKSASVAGTLLPPLPLSVASKSAVTQSAGTPSSPPAPTLDPNSHWPDQNGSVDAPDGAADTPEIVAEGVLPAAPSNPPRRWLPVAALLALIVVATALAIRFAVPRAVIRIVPRVETVSASLIFDVTADGQPLDDEAAFALTPRTSELDVVWEGSAPVTGLRVVPDGTAGGPIELRNASSEPMDVEAGTVVTTEEGIEFTFAESVTVPPIDAATGEPGAATGSVRAVDAGSGGNIETGVLGGRLPNGIYYSNRMQPTEGGTDKEYPIVTQADLDALSAAARASADDLAAEAIAQDAPSNDALVSSVNVKGQSDTFDHKVDDQAETVGARSELTVEATYYDGGAAESEYEPALTQRLAAAAPDGYSVDPERIVFESPAEIDERDGGVRLEVAARVDAEAKLDDAERQALSERLVGATAEEAEAILADIGAIADFTIEFEPGWLPEQMPNNAGRIEFEIAQ